MRKNVKVLICAGTVAVLLLLIVAFMPTDPSKIHTRVVVRDGFMFLEYISPFNDIYMPKIASLLGGFACYVLASFIARVIPGAPSLGVLAGICLLLFADKTDLKLTGLYLIVVAIGAIVTSRVIQEGTTN